MKQAEIVVLPAPTGSIFVPKPVIPALRQANGIEFMLFPRSHAPRGNATPARRAKALKQARRAQTLLPRGAWEQGNWSKKLEILLADVASESLENFLRIADCGLRIADCGLRIADCGLRIADFSSIPYLSVFIIKLYIISHPRGPLFIVVIFTK